MKQFHFLTRFLMIALMLYLAWFFIYESWLKPMGVPDQQLTRSTTEVTAEVLYLIGFDVTFHHLHHKSYLYLEGIPLLGVADECNALILFALFLGFIIAFPGKWLHKVWFSIVGIVAIWVVNILRMLSLSLIQMYYPGALDFNHKYTFTILVYGFIFGLWMLWVKKFASSNSVTTNKKEQQQAFTIETEKI